MAATNAAKAKAATHQPPTATPVNAYAGGEPTQIGSTVFGQETYNLALNRWDMMEVLSSVTISAGHAAERADFGRMTRLIPLCNRFNSYLGQGGTQLGSEIGESPPTPRANAAATA